VSAEIAAHYESAGLWSRRSPLLEGGGRRPGRLRPRRRDRPRRPRPHASPPAAPSARRDGSELDLQLVLAPSYRVTRGVGGPELGHVLEPRPGLCDRVGTPAQRAQILTGMQSRYIVEGRLEKCALITDELGARLSRGPGGSRQDRCSPCGGVRLQMGHFQQACDTIDGLVREATRASSGASGVAGSTTRSSCGRGRHTRFWCLGRSGHGMKARPTPCASPAARAAVQPGHRRHLPGPAPAAPSRSRHVPAQAEEARRPRHGGQGDLLSGVGRHPRRLRGDGR